MKNMSTNKKTIFLTMALTCAVVMSATACSFTDSDIEEIPTAITETASVETTAPVVTITETTEGTTVVVTEPSTSVEDVKDYYYGIGFAYKSTVSADEIMTSAVKQGSGELYDAIVAAESAKKSDAKIEQTSSTGKSNLEYSFSDGTESKTYPAVGDYTEKITASKDGKIVFTVSIDLWLLDMVAPTITGVKDLSCEIGTKINALDGVSAQDETEGAVTVAVSEYNTDKIGDYTLTYTAADSHGNTTTATAKLTVTAPVIKETACDKTMYVTSGTLNIRDSASTAGTKLGSMNYRDSVHVIATVVGSNWVKVEYNGITGYSSGSYLSDKQPAKSQPSTSGGGSGSSSGSGSGTSSGGSTSGGVAGDTDGDGIPERPIGTLPYTPDPDHGY